MNNTPHIKTARQERALLALLKGPISVRDLGPTIGALNPRQIIFELRKQGFKEVIKTREFTVKDRDGNECHPGEYFILDKDKPIIERALKEYIPQARSRRPRGKSPSSNNSDNIKEG